MSSYRSGERKKAHEEKEEGETGISCLVLDEARRGCIYIRQGGYDTSTLRKEMWAKGESGKNKFYVLPAADRAAS